MRRTIRTLVSVSGVVALLGVVGACSDDDSNGDGPIPMDQVETQYMRNYCQVAMDCNLDPMVAFFGGDVNACVDFLEVQGMMDNSLGMFIDSVNAGNTAYDGDMARQCLDAMQSLSCEEIYGEGSPDDSCDQTFTGLLANGSDCTHDMECAGRWCDISAGCPGVCADEVPLGGDCSGNEKCAEGTLCDLGECVADPGPLMAGDMCVDTYEMCGYGLWCDWEGSGLCEDRLGVGQDCWDNEMCDHGLVCGGDAVCEAIQIADAVGDPCGGWEVGPFCNISNGLGCVMVGNVEGGEPEGSVCGMMPGLGESCLEMDESTGDFTAEQCDLLAGLYCDMDFQNWTGVCAAKKAGGAACEDDQECQSDYCQMNGTCWEDSADPCDG